MSNKYGVIYADPPWFYNARNNKKTKFGGGAPGQYPLMKDSELLAMRSFIDSLADNNCALFMWVTMPRLDFGIELMKEWGFRYATNAFTWVKNSNKTGRLIYAPGYYTASNTELCLIGARGSMPPTMKMIESVFILPRGQHSVKPANFREAIANMYPSKKKIELFARELVVDWDSWGMIGDMKKGEWL